MVETEAPLESKPAAAAEHPTEQVPNEHRPQAEAIKGKTGIAAGAERVESSGDKTASIVEQKTGAKVENLKGEVRHAVTEKGEDVTKINVGGDIKGLTRETIKEFLTEKSGDLSSQDQRIAESSIRNIINYLTKYELLRTEGKNEDAQLFLKKLWKNVDSTDKNFGGGIINKTKIEEMVRAIDKGEK